MTTRVKECRDLSGEVPQMKTIQALKTKLIVLIVIVSAFNTAAWAQGRDIGGKRDLDVATFNLYVGADFSPLLALDPLDPAYFNKLIPGVATAHGQGLQSNFPARPQGSAH